MMVNNFLRKEGGSHPPFLNIMPKVAGEVIAYCTKCRMDLMHVVVSMDGNAIAKTQCKSCGGVHRYRVPKSPENVTHSTKVLNKRKHPGSTPKNTSSRRTVADSEKWEELLSAHEQETPRAYQMQECFTEGELISHSVFGTGVVTNVPAPEKIEVHFKEGTKLLVQAR